MNPVMITKHIFIQIYIIHTYIKRETERERARLLEKIGHLRDSQQVTRGGGTKM